MLMKLFTWYWSLFSDQDNKVRIAAWAATVASITFLLTFIIKPLRVFVLKKMGRKTITRLQTFSEIKIKYSNAELKKHITILVVDDDEIFPVSGFREFGYKIDRWEKLDERRLRILKNGEVDVIVLDIIGIANDISENDGLGVLKDIKSSNPCQIIVAYSGQSFDIMKNRFWDLADEKLGKPTPFIGTQEIIDNLIERTFTVDYHLGKIENILDGANLLHESKTIQDLFISFKKSNGEPDWQEALKDIRLKSSDRLKIASILKKLFRFTELNHPKNGA
jgi:hypothetical protein